jgi:hypothetical protein
VDFPSCTLVPFVVEGFNSLRRQFRRAKAQAGSKSATTNFASADDQALSMTDSSTSMIGMSSLTA